jgi:ABC-2 type transport system permease protein
MAVVREREMGTLEQLMVSPLRPTELIIGKTLPVVLVTALDLVLVATVAILWFHVPMRGSVLFLAAGSFCFILAAAARPCLDTSITFWS